MKSEKYQPGSNNSQQCYHSKGKLWSPCLNARVPQPVARIGPGRPGADSKEQVLPVEFLLRSRLGTDQSNNWVQGRAHRSDGATTARAGCNATTRA